MKRRRPKTLALYLSRRNRSINVSADWTSQQVAAILGLLENLLGIIWQQYGTQIHSILSNDMRAAAQPFTPGNLGEEDVPF